MDNEVAFPFRGWQTCPGPTFNTLDEDSLTPGLRLEPQIKLDKRQSGPT
jgi:hypothetical protein